MRLSYEQLLQYDLPAVVHRYTERDTMLYALSLGLGQDPLDEHDLAFVDSRHGPRVLPAMAVILGYPGAWQAAPEVGADMLRLLHGEQGLEVYAEIPPAAEVVGKTRVVDAVDKGEKGLLLYTEKLLTDAATGARLARTFSTHVLRGDGGMPGAPTQSRPAHAVPASQPDHTEQVQTRPEQALLYRLNGDHNPLHSHPATAKAAGFKQPILHGLCTFGMVAHAVARQRQQAGQRLQSVNMRFSGPVYPGETLEVQTWTDGSFRARVIERDSVVIDNGLLRVR